MYTRVQTNIESLLRELSGPRPLRRVVDIVSKPRIWSRGAKAILLDNRPALQVTGLGRTVIILLQTYCTLAFTSTHDCPAPLVCTRWKLRKLRNKPRLMEPFFIISSHMDSHPILSYFLKVVYRFAISCDGIHNTAWRRGGARMEDPLELA